MCAPDALQGPIRRDLKPENFLLADQSDRSELKATDFGLSAFFRPGQVFSEILGSAYYIAPEARPLSMGCHHGPGGVAGLLAAQRV